MSLPDRHPGDPQPVQELGRLPGADSGVLDLLAQPVPRRQRMPGTGGPLDLSAGRPARLLVATALALCTTAGTVAAFSLRPASADIVASQSQLDSLNHQAEAAAERYNKGRIDLEAAQLKVRVATVVLAQQDAQVAAL